MRLGECGQDLDITEDLTIVRVEDQCILQPAAVLSAIHLLSDLFLHLQLAFALFYPQFPSCFTFKFLPLQGDVRG